MRAHGKILGLLMENEVKEPAPKYDHISPEEYLLIERASVTRSEYYRGNVVAMAGASFSHNQILANLQTTIGVFLKRTNCQILTTDMRVSISSRQAYVYPDALIFCGEPQLEDQNADSLLNPSVIFEVLSPSTHKHDAGYKFSFYQQIPSLSEFILIDSRQRASQIFRKQRDGLWQEAKAVSPEQEIFIETIGLTLAMDDI